MKDAVLEIGVETLPARFLAPALERMAASARELLAGNRLKAESVEALGTPRRLVLLLRGAAERSETLERMVKGPPAGLLKDARGNYTPQAEGFAKAQGVRVEDLQALSTPKGDFLHARRLLAGEPAATVLSRVFPALIAGLEFPKTMEWEQSRFRFARPIRNLLALYGAKTVVFHLAGVRSGNKALGLGLGSKPVPIPDAAAYVKKLGDLCVLVGMDRRREAVRKALEQAVRGSDFRVDKDEELLEEIVCLSEHPVPVVGGFREDFLSLPQALLSLVLKRQLKFFPLLSPSGDLDHRFIGMRDGVSEGQKEVQQGYERVLQARLEDARFFYRRDLASPLESKLRKLKGAVFQKGLGSMYDKSLRTVDLSIWLCGELRRRGLEFEQDVVERIARLSYADLASEVVREFPELQGLIGGHYARHDGEGERVARGVEEFYRPMAFRSPIPGPLEGCLASLAGKMDTLAGMFCAGFRPSGSEDPFALRRVGMGIVRIVLERQLPIPLLEFAGQARVLLLEQLSHAGGGLPAPAAGALDEIGAFLWQRAQGCLEEMGYGIDEIAAVEEGALDDLPRAFKRVAAVHALRAEPDFRALAAAFKRVANLLKQAGENPPAARRIDEGLLRHEAESLLYAELRRIEGSALGRASRGDYEGSLRELVSLKPGVDRFFEQVRVMDAEEATKKNRLALLTELARLFKSTADLSRLQPAGNQA